MPNLFCTQPENLPIEVYTAICHGKAKIQIMPSSMICTLTKEPLRKLLVNDEMIGRFSTYTEALEHMIFVVNNVNVEESTSHAPLTDDEIVALFDGTRFGIIDNDVALQRDYLAKACLKVQKGYWNGNTIFSILLRAALITDTKIPTLTQRGLNLVSTLK